MTLAMVKGSIMDRIDRLIKNDDYRRCMESVERAEKERRFCLHGIEHGLDVARISYIINLENQLGYDKEVIYAMALLHDIGRAKEYADNMPHHEAGAEIAGNILRQSGFDEREIGDICQAIASHKKPCEDKVCGLKQLLYSADKLSRSCFDCKAYSDCYWSEATKNNTISI